MVFMLPVEARLEPIIILKNLSIIPSRTTQKFYPLFPRSLPIIPLLFTG